MKKNRNSSQILPNTSNTKRHTPYTEQNVHRSSSQSSMPMTAAHSVRGRKPKYNAGERITITFATTKETKERLRNIAYDNHMNVSDLLTKWVNEYEG